MPHICENLTVTCAMYINKKTHKLNQPLCSKAKEIPVENDSCSKDESCIKFTPVERGTSKRTMKGDDEDCHS